MIYEHMYVIIIVTTMKGVAIMKNMPLLEDDADLSLEALQAYFQANDFSAAVSGYDSDRANSQDNHFYKRLQEHFAKVWNQQMGQLTSRKSLRNFSSNHPVRRLEESEAKLVSGMVMEILDDEQLCQAIMEATLVSMEDSIMDEIQRYAEKRGKTMEELSEKEVEAAFDRFSDQFLGKMMNLLEQVQQVPAIMKTGEAIPAHEDFDKKALKNYDKIDFERKWNHQRTKTGPLLEQEGTIEQTAQDFRAQIAFDAVSNGLDAAFTSEEISRQQFNAFVQSVEDSTDREILYLSADGLTLQEIAKRLGFKNHSAVLKRRDKLRKQFNDFISE